MELVITPKKSPDCFERACDASLFWGLVAVGPCADIDNRITLNHYQGTLPGNNLMDAKSLGRKLFNECWNQGKFELLNDILSPKHIFHLAEVDLEGIPAYRELLEGYYNALNPTFELKHVIAEGSYAAIHYTESGTFLNDWVTPESTYKATGQKYSTF